MTVDRSDPENPEYPMYAVEHDEDEAANNAAEMSLTEDAETPEVDAAEQHTELRQHHDDPLPHYDPATANPADAAEQARVIDLDEDEYR
ncbi:hypothetical protein [Streptomyces sp. NPDC002851]